jgi:hypothetical protein
MSRRARQQVDSSEGIYMKALTTVAVYLRADDPEATHLLSQVPSSRFRSTMTLYAPAPSPLGIEPTWGPLPDSVPITVLAMEGDSGEVTSLYESLIAKVGGRGAICLFTTCSHLASDRPGDQSGGTWRMALVQRQSDLSRDAFAKHWHEHHVPLVLAKGPLFDAYRTNIVIGGDVPWDGMVEQRFQSPEASAEHDRRNRDDYPDVMQDIRRMTASARNYLADAAH